MHEPYSGPASKPELSQIVSPFVLSKATIQLSPPGLKMAMFL